MIHCVYWVLGNWLIVSWKNLDDKIWKTVDDSHNKGLLFRVRNERLFILNGIKGEA
jgi:hypothetical protein